MSKVLITGATGFIGGRLAEILMSAGDDVHALVRGFGKAARLARLPVTFSSGSVTDRAALLAAAEGVDTVYHCAHDWTDAQANIDGIHNLIAACSDAGVRRLVYVSSMSVYEPLPDGRVDERTASDYVGLPYADNKLKMEREVLAAVESDRISGVVIQPTIVYGPYGIAWTHVPAKNLLTGTVVLPDHGSGVCNPVYVDDVCQAMILAAKADGANGERFLISGPDTVTWREFYGAFEDALGLKAVWFLPQEEIQERLSHGKDGSKRPGVVRPWVRANLSKATRRRVRKLRQRLRPSTRPRRKSPHLLHLPDSQACQLYAAKCTIDISKARQQLGYQPNFDFAAGMEITSDYLRWAFPLPSSKELSTPR